MIALLGPPPEELLARETQWSKVDWDEPCPGIYGGLHQNPQQYFEGPFFDSDGK